VPPFEKKVIEIDADRQLFRDRGVATAVIEFATMLAGKAKLQRKATLRVADPDPTSKVAIYHDRETPVALRVSWHSPRGNEPGKLQVLDSTYLFITPPEPPAGFIPPAPPVGIAPPQPSPTPASGSGGFL